MLLIRVLVVAPRLENWGFERGYGTNAPAETIHKSTKHSKHDKLPYRTPQDYVLNCVLTQDADTKAFVVAANAANSVLSPRQLAATMGMLEKVQIGFKAHVFVVFSGIARPI